MAEFESYMWGVYDWRTDELYHLLDNREKGIYRELIDECWVAGSITSDPEVLTRMVHEPLEYFAGVWAKIRRKFNSMESGSRLYHPRLEIDRQRLNGIRKKRTNAGSLGNEEKRRRREIAANAKGTHTKEQWQALLILANFSCVKCGYSGITPQKDHIVPLYQGGSNSIENLQPLCKRCNTAKGPDATDYRKFEWRQLNDLSEVSRICETFAVANRRHIQTTDTDLKNGSLFESLETSTLVTLPPSPGGAEKPKPAEPAKPEKKPRPRDKAMDHFSERCKHYTGSAYSIKRGDTVQLDTLRKANGIANLEKPPEWDQAVENYFASPHDKVSLAELAEPGRYAIYKNSPLDRYKVPINHKNSGGNGNGNGHKSPAARRSADQDESTDRVMAMLEGTGKRKPHNAQRS